MDTESAQNRRVRGRTGGNTAPDDPYSFTFNAATTLIDVRVP
jgi:hypothetical protein